MKNNLVKKPPRLDFPKIDWRSELWLSLIPFLIGFIPFFSDFPNHPIYQTYRLPIGLFLVLSPLHIPIFIWFFKLILISFRRVRFYSLSISYIDLLAQTKRDFFNFIMNSPIKYAYHVLKADYFNDRLLLSIQKNPGEPLFIGNQIVIIDTKDRKPLGIFVIIQVNEENYFAEEYSGIDQTFKGFIVQQGSVSIIPNIIGFYVPEGVKNHE